MNGPHMRILYSRRFSHELVAPVIKVVDGFSTRYGVTYDRAFVENSGMNVKHRGAIRRALTSERPVVFGDISISQAVLDITFRTTIGIGVTDRQLFREVNGTRERVDGIGISNTCAIISVFRFLSLGQKLRDDAIRAVTLHELGHVFGDATKHCEDKSCAMHASNPNLGFCSDCASKVNLGVGHSLFARV